MNALAQHVEHQTQMLAMRSHQQKVVEKPGDVGVAGVMWIRRCDASQNIEFEDRLLAAIRIGRQNFDGDMPCDTRWLIKRVGK
jgi:hypothetical protein